MFVKAWLNNRYNIFNIVRPTNNCWTTCNKRLQQHSTYQSLTNLACYLIQFKNMLRLFAMEIFQVCRSVNNFIFSFFIGKKPNITSTSVMICTEPVTISNSTMKNNLDGVGVVLSKFFGLKTHTHMHK